MAVKVLSAQDAVRNPKTADFQVRPEFWQPLSVDVGTEGRSCVTGLARASTRDRVGAQICFASSGARLLRVGCTNPIGLSAGAYAVDVAVASTALRGFKTPINPLESYVSKRNRSFETPQGHGPARWRFRPHR